MVHADFNEKSAEIKCLFDLLSPDVFDLMTHFINEEAHHKNLLNNPAWRRSVYSSWKPMYRI